MATVSSESNTIAAYPIDLCFDLDEVLTMVENSSCGMTTSNSLVSNMPTVTALDVCAVCMEGIQSSKGGKQVPCGHVYHATCIATWLSLYNSCPLCRCRVSGED
ncbi:hypothetical protein L1049_021701 [Liquidambar formosana]|uniref:RING-type E3 ubiquitin transferase n=1 Tax=Liquidambar formosana TaxID=63359 RepID=A0AAP0RBG6_LIQFO